MTLGQSGGEEWVQTQHVSCQIPSLPPWRSPKAPELPALGGRGRTVVAPDGPTAERQKSPLEGPEGVHELERCGPGMVVCAHKMNTTGESLHAT